MDVRFGRGVSEQIGNTATHRTVCRSHGSMSPLCAYYDIVVILQMDFVLLLRSINDWTHESGVGLSLLIIAAPGGKKPHLIELLCR